MSSSGRLYGVYPLLEIDKAAAFTETKIFRDVENDGVVVHIDQTVGGSTSIQFLTSGHNKMNFTPVKSVTVSGTESITFTVPVHDNLKIVVIGNEATAIKIAVKKTGTMDSVGDPINHTVAELKTIELLGLSTDNLLTDNSGYDLIVTNSGELTFSPTEG